MLQPVRRRTWAPRGQTPVQYSWDWRDRLSVVAAITRAPRRCRFGVYFRMESYNLRTDDVLAFVARLRRHLRRKIILVWDRWSVHRSAARRMEAARADWLTIEWLPAYAPDLNPVEQVWKHTKYDDLANYVPNDVQKLGQAVATSISGQHRKGSLVGSFFKHAGLE